MTLKLKISYQTQRLHMSQSDVSSFSNDSLVKSHDNLSICIEKELENNQMKIEFMKEFIDSKSNQLVDLQNFLIKQFQDIQNFKAKNSKIQCLIQKHITSVLLDLKLDLKLIGNYIQKIPQCFIQTNQQILQKFNDIINQKNEQIFQLKETIKELQSKQTKSQVFPLIEKYNLSASKYSLQKSKSTIIQQQQVKKFQLQNFRDYKNKNVQNLLNKKEKNINFKNIEQIQKSEFFVDDSLEKQSRQRINSRQILDRKSNIYRLQQNQLNKNQDIFPLASRLTSQKNEKSISIQKNARQSFLKNYKRNISQASLTQSKYSQHKIQRQQYSPLRYSQLSSINLKDLPGHNRSLSAYLEKELVEEMKTTDYIRPNPQKNNDRKLDIQRNINQVYAQQSIKEKQNNFEKSPIKDRKKYIKEKIQKIKERERQKQKQKQRQREKSIKKMYF